MEITYDNIKSLISKEEISGSEMNCTFTCPKTGKTIESSAYINQSNSSQIKQNMKQGLIFGIKSAISSMIYRIFGSYGTVGNIVGSATSSAAYAIDVNTDTKYSKDEKKAAVVQAFKQVASNFYWDEKERKWLGAKELSPFMTQLTQSPVSKNYDKEIIARMLVELSNLDNSITSEEREFLKTFIPPGIGSLDELLKKEPVSNIELKEIDAKETALMLAWTIVLIDEKLSDAERKKVNEYATLFGLENEKANELKKLAQQNIIDQGAATGELESKENLFNLADKIELPREEAERMLIQYKKRN